VGLTFFDGLDQADRTQPTSSGAVQDAPTTGRSRVVLAHADRGGIEVNHVDLALGGPSNAATSRPDFNLSEQVTVTQPRKNAVIQQQRLKVNVNFDAIAVGDTHNEWFGRGDTRDEVHQRFLLARKNAKP
jgi:aconitase B